MTNLERLRRWFDLLLSSKRKRAFDDPEMFATYMAVASEANEVVQAHVKHLVDQISRIIADGIVQGVFTVADPVRAGWAVYSATIRFHSPTYVLEWSDPNIDSDFEGVWALVAGGLGAKSGLL